MNITNKNWRIIAKKFKLVSSLEFISKVRIVDLHDSRFSLIFENINILSYFWCTILLWRTAKLKKTWDVIYCFKCKLSVIYKSNWQKLENYSSEIYLVSVLRNFMFILRIRFIKLLASIVILFKLKSDHTYSDLQLFSEEQVQ